MRVATRRVKTSPSWPFCSISSSCNEDELQAVRTAAEDEDVEEVEPLKAFPTRMPTLTRVSVDAPASRVNTFDKTREEDRRRTRVVDQVLVPPDAVLGEHGDDGRAAEGKVANVLASLDPVARLDRHDDALTPDRELARLRALGKRRTADHHGADVDAVDPTERVGVDRHHHPHVLAVHLWPTSFPVQRVKPANRAIVTHVDRAPNGHRVDPAPGR